MPVAIELPQRVTLEIVETEPAMKGQTASSSYKPAMLSNGVRTMVPPHHRRRHAHRGDDGGRLLRRAREGLSDCLRREPRKSFGSELSGQPLRTELAAETRRLSAP